MRMLLGMLFSTGKDKDCSEIAAQTNKWQCVMAWIVIALSLIFSITALCRVHPRLNLDYMGVIIGALSILVAFLVGWNIYSAIDINKRMQQSEDKIEKENKATNKSIYELNEDYQKFKIYMDAESYITAANSLFMLKKGASAIDKIVQALHQYSKIENYSSDVIDEIETSIRNIAVILLKMYKKFEWEFDIEQDRKIYYNIFAFVEISKIKFSSQVYNTDFNTIIDFIKQIVPISENREKLKSLDWRKLCEIYEKYN